MPYKLSGNSVVRADTGAVVKTHSSREKALAHLRALKANVEEAMPGVLGALLEDFHPNEPRGFHGRWVRAAGGHHELRVAEGVGVLLEAFAPAQAASQGKPQTSAGSATFNASKHPRAGGGKFGYTTGGKRATRSSTATSRTLSSGSSGALVKAIQRQLNIPADGKYGPQTGAAVERYQRQHGLQVDGVVGRQTIAALRGHVNPRLVTPGAITSRQARLELHPSRRSSRVKPNANTALGGLVI